jgi:hypothetical protein
VVFSTHVRFSNGAPALTNAARETFRRFLAAGKHVIFMDDVPTLGFDPRSCIKRAGVASSATRSHCAITRAEFDKQSPEHEAILKRLAREFPQVEWFQAAPALCDAAWCYAMMDGRLMYRDRDHLSYDGDLLVGRRYAAWRRALGER